MYRLFLGEDENMNRLLQSKRRGSAIPLSLVAVIILLAMGAGLLSLGFNSRIYSVRTAADITARCAADVGLTTALFEMNEKLKVEPWSDSVLPTAINQVLSNCDATFSYTVVPSASGYTVVSVGECGQAEKRVYATLELQGLFEHAILTRETLTLKSGTLVDGYNSLDPLDTDADVDIGSQSILDDSIILNSGVTVDGDVVVGVGGNPDTAIKDLGATTGDKYAATGEDPLPQITAPTDLFNMGTAISAHGETLTIIPADNGTYTGIVLKQSSTPGVLEISGGDVVLHITGDIKLGQSCEIIVKDGSTLTLYADADIYCGNDSGISTECPAKEAATLQLYATGEGTQLLDVKAKSNWTGVIYAPNADVDLYAGGDAYGSIVAHDFEFKAGGNYHYDEALRQVDVDDEGVHFVVKRWHEGNYGL